MPAETRISALRPTIRTAPPVCCQIFAASRITHSLIRTFQLHSRKKRVAFFKSLLVLTRHMLEIGHRQAHFEMGDSLKVHVVFKLAI